MEQTDGTITCKVCPTGKSLSFSSLVMSQHVTKCYQRGDYSCPTTAVLVSIGSSNGSHGSIEEFLTKLTVAAFSHGLDEKMQDVGREAS